MPSRRWSRDRGSRSRRRGEVAGQPDPASLRAPAGVEVVGYVHELYRHLAAYDVAVVQGGLTTTMELVAAQRPFVSLPLASHMEQRFHVRHRLDRYGAHDWLDFADATPDRLAEAIAGAIGSAPAYRAIDPGGAERAAALIAELLQMGVPGALIGSCSPV